MHSKLLKTAYLIQISDLIGVISHIGPKHDLLPKVDGRIKCRDKQ